MNSVFLVWHTHGLSADDEDEKLIGVYSTHANAEAAINRLKNKPGFRDTPEGFEIAECVLDRDGWTEGYISATDALTEVSNIPALLTSHVLGFEASTEYHNLRDYELDIAAVVCGAFAKYMTRLFVEVQEGKEVSLHSALDIIENLSQCSNPKIVDLVLTEILENMDLSREQMEIFKSLSGQKTKELIAKCLDYRY